MFVLVPAHIAAVLVGLVLAVAADGLDGQIAVADSLPHYLTLPIFRS